MDNKEQVKSHLIIEEDSVSSEKDLPAVGVTEEDDEFIPEAKEEELKLKSSLFTVHSTKYNKYVQYSMNLESVLYGHEDWIYTVKFHPKIGSIQPLILLSASIDKTMVVWKYNEENSIWIDEV